MISRKLAKRTGCIKYLAALATSFLLIGAVGCASSPTQASLVYEQEVPVGAASAAPEVTQLYQKLLAEGSGPVVLNHLETGLVALDKEEVDVAAYSLERALLRIESNFGYSRVNLQPKKLWWGEQNKIYMGEPYERSMAYYYRGLTYLMQEPPDLQNARACYNAGLVMDQMAHEDAHRGDFEIMLFMYGWISRMDGDEALAQEAFSELRSKLPGFIPPPANHNLLVIAETGFAPKKVGEGFLDHQLAYERRGDAPEVLAVPVVNGTPKRAMMVTDVFEQAATRGARRMDMRNKQKALMHEKFDPYSDPNADIRCWKNLPDKLHVYTCAVDGLPGTISVEFADGSGQRLPGLTDKTKVHPVANGYGLAWARSRSALENVSLEIREVKKSETVKRKMLRRHGYRP